jgi:uncharacterized protein involved in exopolysaccharide biosynthesis
METPVTNWHRVYTLRDFSGAIFRQRPTAAVCFLLIVAAVVAFVVMVPDQYESEMRFVVRHDRADSLITSSPGDNRVVSPDVTEQEVNSEIELLQGTDLLAQAVQSTGLADRQFTSTWDRIRRTLGWTDRVPASAPINTRKQARAVQELRAGLQVAPVRRTSMISVKYTSQDPTLAKEVVDTLSRLYLEKHLAVHRTPGARQFFVDQATQSAHELDSVQAELRAFSEKHGTVSAAEEREAVLAKVAEFESARRQTDAALAEAAGRLTALQRERISTPAQHTSSVTTGDALGFTQEMQSKLVALEVKRTELLQKFTPQYRLVVEVDEQIESARAALADAHKSQVRQETTSENPTMRWLENEIARVRTEHSALYAKSKALESALATYRQEAQRLDASALEQAGLLRELKATEEKYVLYQRKEEEARISEALDRTRISNVMIVQAATLPIEPMPRQSAMWLGLSVLVALVVAVGAAFMKDVVASSFRIRTPNELETTLADVPVLAWVPSAVAGRR